MLLTEKEVRRIVSIHFKEKYNVNVRPEDTAWKYDGVYKVEYLVLGGDIIGENNQDSD